MVLAIPIKKSFARDAQQDYEAKLDVLLQTLRDQLVLVEEQDESTDYSIILDEVLSVHNAQFDAENFWFTSTIVLDDVDESTNTDPDLKDTELSVGDGVLSNIHLTHDFVLRIEALCCTLELDVALPPYSICKEYEEVGWLGLTSSFEDELIEIIDHANLVELGDFASLTTELEHMHFGLAYDYVPATLVYDQQPLSIDFIKGDYNDLVYNMLESGQYTCTELWGATQAMAYQIKAELHESPEAEDYKFEFEGDWDSDPILADAKEKVSTLGIGDPGSFPPHQLLLRLNGAQLGGNGRSGGSKH